MDTPVNELEAIRIDDDEEVENVFLGFVEKSENQWSLCREYFPNKAGGVPAWLDPLNIPSGKSSLCDICGHPLQFLLQVYAPTEKESTYHRMLFVFMCPSMTCLLKDQYEQWKHHQERPSRRECLENYGSHKPTGNGGDKLCSSCRQVQYCSAKHQVMSWRSGHKIACKQMKVSSPVCGPNKSGTTSLESRKVGSNNVWPEFEIITGDESGYNRDISKDNAFSNSLISGNRIDDTMSSLLDSFQGDDDKKSWGYFQERIVNAPDQVLGYYRKTNAKPIWPVSNGWPSKADIPKCSYCGGPMSCEFQIMPQLLYYFGVDIEVDSLDWASIVVYTCEASREAGLPYKDEYAWVQLYSLSSA